MIPSFLNTFMYSLRKVSSVIVGKKFTKGQVMLINNSPLRDSYLRSFPSSLFKKRLSLISSDSVILLSSSMSMVDTRSWMKFLIKPLANLLRDETARVTSPLRPIIFLPPQYEG